MLTELETMLIPVCVHSCRGVCVSSNLPFSDLAVEKCCLSLVPENIKTSCLITESSDLNSHVSVHTMLKAWEAQKWLLWPCSLKLLIVKQTSCSSKDLTLVRIRWRWFGTLSIMLVEIPC